MALLFHDQGTRNGEWSAARPGRSLPPGKNWYPLYRRLGGPQGRFGRTENIAPPGFDHRTVHSVVSRYTDWATRSTKLYADTGTRTNVVCFRRVLPSCVNAFGYFRVLSLFVYNEFHRAKSTWQFLKNNFHLIATRRFNSRHILTIPHELNPRHPPSYFEIKFNIIILSTLKPSKYLSSSLWHTLPHVWLYPTVFFFLHELSICH
jgi:hypothetical protein